MGFSEPPCPYSEVRRVDLVTSAHLQWRDPPITSREWTPPKEAPHRHPGRWGQWDNPEVGVRTQVLAESQGSSPSSRQKQKVGPWSVCRDPGDGGGPAAAPSPDFGPCSSARGGWARGLLPLTGVGVPWDGAACGCVAGGFGAPGWSQAFHALPQVALPLGRSRWSVLLGRPELGHAPGPGWWRPSVPLHVLGDGGDVAGEGSDAGAGLEGGQRQAAAGPQAPLPGQPAGLLLLPHPLQDLLQHGEKEPRHLLHLGLLLRQQLPEPAGRGGGSPGGGTWPQGLLCAPPRSSLKPPTSPEVTQSHPTSLLPQPIPSSNPSSATSGLHEPQLPHLSSGVTATFLWFNELTWKTLALAQVIHVGVVRGTHGFHRPGYEAFWLIPSLHSPLSAHWPESPL